MREDAIIRRQWFCSCGYEAWESLAYINSDIRPVLASHPEVHQTLKWYVCKDCGKDLMKNWVKQNGKAELVEQRVEVAGCLVAFEEEPCSVTNA